MYSVAELMSTGLETLPASATIQQAMALMSEKHIRHIPVVDDKGRLQGLVSHRDLLAASGPRLGENKEAPAADMPLLSDIMTEQVETVLKNTSLRVAAQILVARKFGCLPVTDKQGKLVGIITDSDFVNIAANLLEQMEFQEPDEDF
ncbi:MAG: CBS domain-containing protein [Gammaproteobacteria bacterium]|nr:CBS domain-containing protein [Gammaproteobacteria bacterium]